MFGAAGLTVTPRPIQTAVSVRFTEPDYAVWISRAEVGHEQRRFNPAPCYRMAR